MDGADLECLLPRSRCRMRVLVFVFSHCASSPIVILIYDAGDDARTKKMRRSSKEQ